jgi:hypothetical protein
MINETLGVVMNKLLICISAINNLNYELKYVQTFFNDCPCALFMVIA